jgi:hypothetical protein
MKQVLIDIYSTNDVNTFLYVFIDKLNKAINYASIIKIANTENKWLKAVPIFHENSYYTFFNIQ